MNLAPADRTSDLPDAASAPALDSPELAWLPFLLQTSDALFPTGAYAHSLGFEEIVRLQIVRDAATLRDYLHQQLLPALAHLELPYLRLAFECDLATSLDALLSLDHEISAWKLARETRAASIQLGIRRLRALQSIHPAPLLAAYDTALEEGRAAGHHLIVSALQARLEAIPLRAALTVYAYQTLAACCGAALKLLRLGQDGCQRTLRAASGEIPLAVSRSLNVARADAGHFNPLLDIASMRHATATERLFIS